MHVGTHEVPEVAGTAQVPSMAFTKVGFSVQEVVEHEPDVNHSPSLHIALRVPEKPVLQTGLHEVPDDVGLVQSPALASIIVGKELQEVEVQTPSIDHAPALQVAEQIR